MMKKTDREKKGDEKELLAEMDVNKWKEKVSKNKNETDRMWEGEVCSEDSIEQGHWNSDEIKTKGKEKWKDDQ